MPSARSFQSRETESNRRGAGSEPACLARGSRQGGGGRGRSRTSRRPLIMRLHFRCATRPSCCGRESNPGLAPVRRQRGLIRPAARPRAAATRAAIPKGIEPSSAGRQPARLNQMRTGPDASPRGDSNSQRGLRRAAPDPRGGEKSRVADLCTRGRDRTCNCLAAGG
jgi:hypothetical protein